MNKILNFILYIVSLLYIYLLSIKFKYILLLTAAKDYINFMMNNERSF